MSSREDWSISTAARLQLALDLLATFPAALAIAGEDLGAPTFLRLLERWPGAEALSAASHAELVAFARESKHGWPERFADRVEAALAGDHFQPRPYLVRAKADTVRLTAGQLLQIGAQRRAWERRMGELLLGAPRRGRSRRPRPEEVGEGFPGGEIYLSFPGLGDRLAARAQGKGRHAALRALGNRWLELLWHCLRKDVSHEEDIHAANRRRALEPLTKAA